MIVSRNLLAGLASSVWSALLGLAVVPFYLKYLGMEAYGLIGFFITMQAIMSLLDMGITPTINREVARCSAIGDLKEAGKLLHTLAVVYWCMAGFISLLVFALAPFISNYWLQLKDLSTQTISHAVMMMGLVIACRWPIALYQAALIGAQRLKFSSGISIIMTTISNLGAVAVLAFVSPTIEAFFIWQACAGFVYAITMRWGAWQIIGKTGAYRFDTVKLKSIWRFSAGMSGIAISTIILMQLDKVLLSKMLSLEDFGRYMLAMTVANGLLVLLTPVFNVIYPRMSAIVAVGETESLIGLYRSGTRLLSTVIFPITITAGVFSKDLLFLWTGNLNLASSAAPMLSLLLFGTALNGIMLFPYALQLAHGLTKLTLTICVTAIIFNIPLMIFLVISYGAFGGALAWALLGISYLIFGTWMTHRKLLKGLAFTWLIKDVCVPFGLSLILVMIGWTTLYVEGAYLMNLFFGGLLAFIAISVNLFLLHGDIVLKLWRHV